MSLAVAGILALAVSGPGTAQVVDPGLAPYLNDTVRAVAVQDDGRLLIGGQFTQVDGQPRPYLARLAADGTLAAALAFPDDQVNALAVLADGTSSSPAISATWRVRPTTVARLPAGLSSPIPASSRASATPPGSGRRSRQAGRAGHRRQWFRLCLGQPQAGLAR